jgi:hypothetical protein
VIHHVLLFFDREQLVCLVSILHASSRLISYLCMRPEGTTGVYSLKLPHPARKVAPRPQTHTCGYFLAAFRMFEDEWMGRTMHGALGFRFTG